MIFILPSKVTFDFGLRKVVLKMMDSKMRQPYYFFRIIESITYQVMMMAKAGKLRIIRISAAMPMKYKQNLFSFQLFNLNFSENIGISEIKRYDDRKTSNNMII